MGKIILKNVIQAAVALVFLLLAWVIAYLAAGNELLVPSPLECIKELGTLLTFGGFWKGFGMSLLRTLGAFAISFALALVFALVAYLVPAFGRIFTPIASVMRSMPVLAVLLILLVWWGAAVAPVAVAFLSLFPMLYAGISAALLAVDGDLIEMSRVYNVPLKKRILGLYLPTASPYVLRESGAALSFSLKLVVSAEVLAGTAKSLGGMMQEAQAWKEMPSLFALVIVSFLVGLLLETAIAAVARAVERRVK